MSEPDRQFAWTQPSNFDDDSDPAALEPSYANPPSAEVAKFGADRLVMADELAAQVQGPRRDLVVLLVVYLLVGWLSLLTGVPQLALAWLVFFALMAVLPLTEMARMGRWPAPMSARQILKRRSRMGAFGRSYTALSVDETIALVLAAAAEEGIELTRTGPTTWSGTKPADFKYEPSTHQVDIRPSVDRPGMTMITALAEFAWTGLGQPTNSNWALNYAILHAPPDAERVDPRSRKRPSQLPSDSFDSRSGRIEGK